jgi:hypothetical protein
VASPFWRPLSRFFTLLNVTSPLAFSSITPPPPLADARGSVHTPIPTIAPSKSTTCTPLPPKPLPPRAIIKGDAVFPLIRYFCCALLRISPNPPLTPLFPTLPIPLLPRRCNNPALIRHTYPLIRNTYATDSYACCVHNTFIFICCERSITYLHFRLFSASLDATLGSGTHDFRSPLRCRPGPGPLPRLPPPAPSLELLPPVGQIHDRRRPRRSSFCLRPARQHHLDLPEGKLSSEKR